MHRRLAAPLLLTLACGPATTDDTTASTGGESTADPTTPTTGGTDLPQTLLCSERDKLDVMLVVEDSPAMQDSQELTAMLARTLIDIIQSELDVDLHLAVVSASIGGKQCTNANVHDGEFLTTPCTARPDDFSPTAAAACQTACPLSQLEILPTTTTSDPNPAPRPWLASDTQVTNVDVDLADAAACIAPQGDAGCTFPAPLTAMARALDRALDPQDPAFGFLRADAHLRVVFVGTTSDCSVRPTAQGIFSPDSPFLSDPMLVTPGICWNAGVRCTGDPDAFTDCTPEHHAIDGTPGASPEDAVLEPVATHIDRLQSLLDNNVVTSVGVGVLTGVPTAYPDKPIVYTTTCEPAELATAAICPGCTAMGRQASPPVRLRALAEAFKPDPDENPNLVSLCGGDPSAVWSPYFGSILDQIKPACVDVCVADGDPSTELLDPDCTIFEALPDQEPVALPTCEPHPDDIFVLPDGVDTCAAILPPQFMSVECTDMGANAEVIILRSKPAADGACISVSCVASSDPATDCPAP